MVWACKINLVTTVKADMSVLRQKLMKGTGGKCERLGGHAGGLCAIRQTQTGNKVNDGGEREGQRRGREEGTENHKKSI